ncbi:MAG: hypothetical protein CVT95_00970 [Bacteroidetes bacterium HGW-Bacteroidetes-12]|nr:MAG: hypothetical protein CVT95_00970 [Bacteroidetes bacterium HGW-Bacteroidetes-12]
MILKTILTVILFYIVCSSNAQITISGVVINEATKEPLEYASISILNQSFGTISNGSGAFTFHLDPKFLNDTLVISSLGYIPFKKKIASLIQLDSAIYELTPTEINLTEFLVTSLSANEIVKKAIQNIPKNYPKSPFLLKGFYRHFRNENDQCVDLIEMALILKDKDYSAPYKVKTEDKEAYISRYQESPVTEEIYVEQFRRSFNNQNFYKEYFFNNNMIVEMLRNNRVKYRNFELDTNITNYYFAGQLMLNDKNVFIISTEKEGGAKIYIDAETFAIIKLENYVPWSGNYLFQKKVKNYDKAIERERSMRITLEFQELNNKMYLKYLNYAWSYEIYSEEKQKTVVLFDVNNLLVINEIIEYPKKSDFDGTKKMKKNQRLENFNCAYHESFWVNYNLIEINPIKKIHLQELEKKVPLKKQFKQSQEKKTGN